MRPVTFSLVFCLLTACLHPRYLPPGFAVPDCAALNHEAKTIPTGTAVQRAVSGLRDRGVREVQVCAVECIAAPLSGVLVDAMGKLRRGGATYTEFRIGILDMSESGIDLRPGDEFSFLAHGSDESGREAWLPPLGMRETEFVYDHEWADPELGAAGSCWKKDLPALTMEE